MMALQHRLCIKLLLQQDFYVREAKTRKIKKNKTGIAWRNYFKKRTFSQSDYNLWHPRLRGEKGNCNPKLNFLASPSRHHPIPQPLLLWLSLTQENLMFFEVKWRAGATSIQELKYLIPLAIAEQRISPTFYASAKIFSQNTEPVLNLSAVLLTLLIVEWK